MQESGTFTTVTVDNRDDLADTCSQSLVPFSVHHAPEQFEATVTSVVLPGAVTLLQTVGDRAESFRSARKIRQEPRDHVLLYGIADGQAALQQNDRNTGLQTGTAAFYYSELPLATRHAPRGGQIGVQVERAALRISDDELRHLVARRVDSRENLSLRVLARLADEVLAGDPASVSATEWEAISHAVSGLMRGIVGSVCSNAAPGSPPPGFEDSRLITRQTALMYMDQHFADPATSPQSVAEHLHVSRRHLYRVLDEIGLTPSSYIRDLRLARAARLLREGCSVDVAARRSGFSSTATFRRVFKQRFGSLPSRAVFAAEAANLAAPASPLVALAPASAPLAPANSRRTGPMSDQPRDHA